MKCLYGWKNSHWNDALETWIIQLQVEEKQEHAEPSHIVIKKYKGFANQPLLVADIGFMGSSMNVTIQSFVG